MVLAAARKFQLPLLIKAGNCKTLFNKRKRGACVFRSLKAAYAKIAIDAELFDIEAGFEAVSTACNNAPGRFEKHFNITIDPIS